EAGCSESNSSNLGTRISVQQTISGEAPAPHDLGIARLCSQSLTALHAMLADALHFYFREGLMTVSRRDFLTTAVVGSLSMSLTEKSHAQDSASTKPGSSSGKRPIIVRAHNGFNYLDDAY